MNVFELIKEKLEKHIAETYYESVKGNRDAGVRNNAYHNAKDIVEEVEKEYKQGNCTNDCTHFDNAVQYGYNKAIDEFAEKMKTNSKLGYIGYLDKVIDEIAEQLKGGSDER